MRSSAWSTQPSLELSNAIFLGSFDYSGFSGMSLLKSEKTRWNTLKTDGFLVSDGPAVLGEILGSLAFNPRFQRLS